jgi:hypothetical protein
MFDVIPVNWKNITILGAFIPVILSAQPLWIFQALKNQPAQYRSRTILALSAFILTFAFLDKNSNAEREVLLIELPKLGHVIC